MQAIDNREWQSLPEQAQQEIYDFFLFIKQRYEQQARQAKHDKAETRLFSKAIIALIWLRTGWMTRRMKYGNRNKGIGYRIV